MIFSLTMLLMGLAMLLFMASILNAQSYDDKAAMELMEEIRQAVGGTISEYKILYYQLGLRGTYADRQVECLYRRYPRSSGSPQVLFSLKPVVPLKIKHFPFLYPTVARGITLRKGMLVCKCDAINYPKLSREDVTAILDGLVQAEIAVKNREHGAKGEQGNASL